MTMNQQPWQPPKGFTQAHVGDKLSSNQHTIMSPQDIKSREQQLGIGSRSYQMNNGHLSPMGSFKKGGSVKKTGVYKLHKGEEVLNKQKVMAQKMTSNPKEKYQSSRHNVRKYLRDVGGWEGAKKDFYAKLPHRMNEKMSPGEDPRILYGD